MKNVQQRWSSILLLVSIFEKVTLQEFLELFESTIFDVTRQSVPQPRCISKKGSLFWLICHYEFVDVVRSATEVHVSYYFLRFWNLSSATKEWVKCHMWHLCRSLRKPALNKSLDETNGTYPLQRCLIILPIIKVPAPLTSKALPISWQLI